MSKWPKFPLSHVAVIERDSISPEQIANGTLYVGLENISRSGSLVDVRTVDNGDLASSKFAFTNDHILYGKLRPYLRKIARPSFNGICSTDILPIRALDGMDKNFLAHFLRLDSSISFVNSRTSGANLPRISPSALESIQVPVPPLREQWRIAAILDQAEALGSKRRRSIAKLEDLSASVFLDLFGDPQLNSAGWTTCELGTLIADGPQNGLYRPAEDYGTGTPILRIDAFYDGKVTSMASLRRLRLPQEEISRYGLAEGDIVINRVNSLEYLGKSAIIPAVPEPTVFESNMMRFRTDATRLNGIFLMELLQTNFIKRQILARAKNAVNQSSINQSDVQSLTIIVPPLDLQRRFSRIASAAAARAATYQKSQDSIDSLFSSLQSESFRTRHSGSKEHMESFLEHFDQSRGR